MKLIVGLGNPGPEYAYTRHNVGFLTIDTFHRLLKAPDFKAGFKGLYSKAKYQDQDLIIFKPLTYMNLSGSALVEIISYFKINVEDIIVIYDDMDYEVGVFSIREQGGHGGHNGMRDIIDHLKTKEFKRIRIGIGKANIDNKAGYVLGKFGKVELEILREVVDRINNALIETLTSPFPKVMTKYNTKEAK
jgi:peptidyl-tRNA hydrolase, PTH1 family